MEIETGISNDNYVEVKSGLAGGETVQVVSTTTTSSGRSSSSSSGMMSGQSGRDSMMGDMQSQGGFDKGSRTEMSGGQMPTMPSGGM